jgi:DNA adenine methylase
MPSYGGGKSLTGKEIYKFITEQEDSINWEGDYFEPFCGLLGVGIHAAKDGRAVEACDSNKDLIMMLQKIKTGWLPPMECSREKYEELKQSQIHSPIRGFMGIAGAYSGIFFAGYRPISNGRDFLKTTRKGLLRMKPHLDKINLIPGKSYKSFNPLGKTIYCDPPYKGNNFKSEHFDKFDHNEFWELMRLWSVNNLVLISEYSAPKDFICVWEKNVKSVYSSKKKEKIEKIFIYKGLNRI